MNRQALAWAVALVAVACGSGSALVERSAPARPAWVGLTPAARDSLYFVGTCSELPSYQEALSCARAEALTDVAAWVGGRFSAYVYRSRTEESRSGGTSVYFDSNLFLADMLRGDTYHEVREGDWGRSYRVSVLLAYPRREAEAEKARIEETTLLAERVVAAAPAHIEFVASEGRWGEAMDELLKIAGRVVVPRNLHRAEHSRRLAALGEDLVTPLEISARVDGTRVEAEARFESAPAAGVPLECVVGTYRTAVVTDDDGRAVCEQEAPKLGSMGRVAVRPDLTNYLAALPNDAAGVANVLGVLLDRAVQLEAAAPLDLQVVLGGGAGCEPAMEVLRERLQEAGVLVSGFGKGVPALRVSCDVEDGESAGSLYTATARASLVLKMSDRVIGEVLEPVRGLGATQSAAREDAAVKLGHGLVACALELLRDIDVKRKK